MTKIDMQGLVRDLQDDIDEVTFTFMTERLWPIVTDMLIASGYDTTDDIKMQNNVELIARGMLDGIAKQVKV